MLEIIVLSTLSMIIMALTWMSYNRKRARVWLIWCPPRWLGLECPPVL